MIITQLYLYYNNKFTTAIKLQPGAFNASEFRQLQVLHLANIHVEILPFGLFNGLDDLTELLIDNSTILKYEPKVFDDVRKSLKILHIQQTVSPSEPPNLNTLLANTTFDCIDTLTMRTNLAGQLNQKTFIGLSTLFSLDLAHCHIQTLGANTFHPLSKKLMHLNLAGNHLRTIPADLFDPFVGRPLRINLDDNPWHCNCALRELQIALERIVQIFGTLNCATPVPCLTDQPVQSAELCSPDGETDTECAVPTAEPTSTPSTELDTTSTVQPDVHTRIFRTCVDEFSEECEEIEFRGQTNIESVLLEDDGWLRIQLFDRMMTPANRMVIIWFETILTTLNDTASTGNESEITFYQNSDEVLCRSSNNLLYRVGPLLADTAYTICLVDRFMTTVSPFDCLPYYNQTEQEYQADVWIAEAEKPLVIGLVVLGAAVSFIIGVLLSFMLLRRYPMWMHCCSGCLRGGSSKSSAAAPGGGDCSRSGRGSGDTMVMSPEWQKGLNNRYYGNIVVFLYVIICVVSAIFYSTAPRYSDVSTICDRRSLQKTGTGGVFDTNYLPDAPPLAKSASAPPRRTETTENEYYLDFLPPMMPPPLPPPNHPPMLYGMRRASADAVKASIEENYYSQVGVKSRQRALQ